MLGALPRQVNGRSGNHCQAIAYVQQDTDVWPGTHYCPGMTLSKVSVFLIADTHSPMRRTIRSMLLECGFSEIHEVDNGATALQKLKSGKFDFVITDTVLPGLDGFQLLSAIRADVELQRLPVLLVTADAHAANVIHAGQQGASGYIVKPFTRATLEEKIALICKKLHLPAPSTCIAAAIQS